jgi:hypothetical protein
VVFQKFRIRPPVTEDFFEFFHRMVHISSMRHVLPVVVAILKLPLYSSMEN